MSNVLGNKGHFGAKQVSDIPNKKNLYHSREFLFQDLLHTTLNALQLYNTNLLWREKTEKKIQTWTSVKQESL